jgi:predicted RNA binding protein YcfA (HicA-like mRNA interferase family)
MGWKLPLLTPREVRQNLKGLDFHHKRTDGSHEQWERPADDILPERKMVTVDSAEYQFRHKLMKHMIRQSGFTAEEFCSGQYSKKRLAVLVKKPVDSN